MRDEFYLIKNENGIVTDVIHNGKGKKYTVKYDRTMDNAMFGYLLSYNTYDEDTVYISKENYGSEEYTRVNRDEWCGYNYKVYIPESKFDIVYAIKKLKLLFMKNDCDVYKKDLKLVYKCEV